MDESTESPVTYERIDRWTVRASTCRDGVEHSQLLHLGPPSVNGHSEDDSNRPGKSKTSRLIDRILQLFGE